MKVAPVAGIAAAALLGLGGAVHADEHGRGWGGRWGGGWQAQQPHPRQAYPQPPYPQQVYPQQVYPRQPVDPQQGYPVSPQGGRRHGPPGYGPAPQPMPPQYAPAPQWGPPPPPRWNPAARGFRPGDVLPPQYRQRQFIVRDWRSHRLYAPPPGYVWVQPEPGSYLLIGNNGMIASMLVGQ